ncbi:MAG TPA: GntR family transcriptional regulator [Lachnospiraceae bacterium]|nr:GntR family transcriptional regulator [Lachnospiraceae bacterium]MDD7665035.1 GntR family transcriptional regulator [Lachnospiraceae bacterium]MDY4165468.1 GntR family transcriptional regulator [Lachnospiraceae bacterium]HAP03482.1 GntR family transcriptional regulator [Lachnospiraceae bacterium]
MTQQNPQYKKVVEYIMSEIENGSLKEGSRLPSEKELCEMFSLSRQTIRHATGELEKNRVITRVKGSGTYVGDQSRPRRKPRYRSVAVMLTYVNSYIFPPVLQGISNTLNNKGYSVSVSFTNNDIEREKRTLEQILSSDKVDALIAEPSKSALPNPNMNYYRMLEKRGIPVLFINSSYPKLDMPCIRLDDEGIGYEAVKYLISQGHRDIAAVFHCEDLQGIRRYAGFDRALRENGIVLDPEKVIWLDTAGVSDLDPLMDYITKRISTATAVFAYNDEVACQLIRGFNRKGIRVPDDISVIGVDDAEAARTAEPPLTTFPHPKAELGIMAAQKIIEQIENPLMKRDHLFLPEIIVRDSVKNLNKEEK